MYFQGYAEDSGAEQLPSHGDRVPDPGGPVLPFDYLDARVFEMLAYRLLCAERPQDRIVLMQGTGERGRDILVYRDQRLGTIVQCKNYRERLPASLVKQELLKLAIHSLIDPSVLPGSLRYELWCGSGLGEEAELLIATWPTRWTEPSIKVEAERVLGRYAAFASLTWNDVRGHVLDTFRDRITVDRVDNIALSARVRKMVHVYAAFFAGGVVMQKTDVEQALEKLVAKVSASSALTDADARRMVDRILSFPQDQRLIFFSSILLGVSPKLIARFRRKEYEELATHIQGITMQLTQTIMKVCQRLQLERVADFRRRVDGFHPSLPALLGQLLTFSMLARLTHVQMPRLAPKAWTEYHGMTLEQRIDDHIEWQYDDYQKCLSGYDRKRHKPGSDPEFRYRIAVKALAGAKSREEFRAAIKESATRHMAELKSTYDDWMAEIPTQLLLISDSVSIFEDRTLLSRLVDNDRVITALRGGVLPE